MNNDIAKKILDVFLLSNKITFFTGAGISTNCGIPDFRGPKGLYSFVQEKYNLPYPEAIFDINYFCTNPKPFFDLSKDLLSNKIIPSISHKFIAWLEEKNKISLVMTQNIDMLHQKAGNKKVLGCHGTYSTATCINCKKQYILNEIEDSLKAGKPPVCKCNGIIKPDIVFFGEQLPSEFFNAYQNPPETDLLVVMGTSLTVQPAASFALKLSTTAKYSIIVNLSSTDFDGHFKYSINEDLDKFSSKIWEDLEKII